MTKAKRTEVSLARLTPESQILIVDGDELRIAGNAAENSLLSKVLASQIRERVQLTLKQYRDDGLKFSPKELRDIAEAGKAVTELCGNAFKDELPNPMKQAQPAEEADHKVDFSGLSKTPEVKPQPNADSPSDANPQPAGTG